MSSATIAPPPAVTTTSAAHAWHAAGYAVVPARTDGTKAPLTTWKQYQSTPPTLDEVTAWFRDAHPGLGLICGAVSGNLEMLELEGRAVTGGHLTDLQQLMADAELDHVWHRLTAGYAERTPSGGLHLLYRVDGAPVPGNLKLASTATNDVLAETRGEGGYVVVAPSHGPVHPTGGAWTLHGNSRPGRVPTITADERAQLHDVVRALNHHPQPAAPANPGPFTPPAPPQPADGHLSPGDHYAQHTDWAHILTPHGWRLVYTRGQLRAWCRPGKAVGVSATTDALGTDRLRVFTTSTDFDTTSYSKLGAYAVLNHHGDLAAAAKALHDAGYGTRPRPTPALAPFTTGPPAAAASNGNGTHPPNAAPAATTFNGFAATLLRRSKLRDLPPVAPLIDGVMSLRSSVVLVGGTGLGKTFLALSWACSVTTGLHWLGQPVHRVKGLFVVGEGATGLDARVSAWEQTWHTSVDDDDLIFSVKPDSLANPNTWAQMREQCLDLHIRFVILDTFSSLAPDADETKDAASITRRLSDFTADIDGTGALIHHPGWGDAGRTRGGSQLEANVDEVIVLKGDKDSELVEMTRKKVKEGSSGESRWLGRRAAFDSIVIESANSGDVDAPLTSRIVRILGDCGGRFMSVPQLQAELGNVHRSSLYRALDRLVSAGTVREHAAGDRRSFAATEGDQDPALFTAPASASR